MAKFEYDYYSGAESDQFRFLRIPKVFFEDSDYEDLGSDEKILYGFLHEQVDFSQKNGWVDEQGRTYVIRSLESIQKLLHNCSPDKARTTLKNLIDYGLIEKKRRGQGKPDLIYVKNFVTKKGEKTNSKKEDDCGKLFSENENSGFLKAEKTDSRSGENRVLEVGNSAPNNTNLNNTKSIEPYPYPIQDTDNTTGPVDNSGCDSDDDAEALIELIKDNLDYEIYSERYKSEHDNRYEELFQVIIEMVIGDRDSIVIGGTKYPQSIVKKRFLSLTPLHIEYVMGRVGENLGEIRNIKKYMIAALFNAPTTMDTYFTQLVHHDMYGGGWEEANVRKQRREETDFDRLAGALNG